MHFIKENDGISFGRTQKKCLSLQHVFHGIRLLRLKKKLVVVRQSIFFRL